jgi:hypothetical protein
MQSIASLIEDDSLYFTASSELDMNPTKPKIKKTIKSLSEHGMSQNSITAKISIEFSLLILQKERLQ